MGERGARPVVFDASHVSPIWLQGIREIPGVIVQDNLVGCAWDIAWCVAKLLGVEPPQEPQHDGELPGIPRYRELELHKKTWHHQKEDILFLARRGGAVLAEPMRCLGGSTEVIVNRAGCSRRFTLTHMAKMLSGGDGRYTWRRDIDSYVACYDEEGSIVSNRLIAFHHTGKKEAFKVSVGTHNLVASADHQFRTCDGYVRLADLRRGDRVLVRTRARSVGEVRIDSIEQVEDQEMFDLSLEAPYNNYVANDFIVHNSGKCLIALGASIVVDSRRTLIMSPALPKLGWADEVQTWTKEPAVLLEGRGARDIRIRCLECNGRGGNCSACRSSAGISKGYVHYHVHTLRRLKGASFYNCPRHPDVLGEEDNLVCLKCRKEMIDIIASHRYILANYDILIAQHYDVGGGSVQKRQDLTGWVDTLKGIGFDVAVCDEAHRLRGWTTSAKRRGERRNDKVFELLQHVPRVWALTGTPFYGFTRDIFWPLEIATGGLYSSGERLRGINFMRRYCEGKQGTYGFEANGRSVYAETELVERLKRVMIQRPREEIFANAAVKIRQVIRLELESVFPFIKGGGRKTDVLSKMIMAVSRAKFDAVLNELVDEIAAGAKIVVFFFNVSSVRYGFKQLEKELSKKVYGPRMREVSAKAWMGTGEDDYKIRYARARAFREHEGAGAFLATIDGMPEGISLRGAQTTHFVDLHWSPGALFQAEDRAYSHDIAGMAVRQYVAADSVDEHILAEVLPKVETLARLTNEKGAGETLDAFSRAEERRTIDTVWDRMVAHLKHVKDIDVHALDDEDGSEG